MKKKYQILERTMIFQDSHSKAFKNCINAKVECATSDNISFMASRLSFTDAALKRLQELCGINDTRTKVI